MTTNSEHHRRSIRLKGYDYTQPGAYFITICTYQNACLFGEIITGKMHLNSFGLVAYQELTRLPQRFPHMAVDESIIMPDHIHAIWRIQEGWGTAAQIIDQTLDSTRRAPTRQIPDSYRHDPTEQFGKPVPGSIPTMVRSYKSSVALRIRRMRGAPIGPIWQRNYYEHIIRSEAEWQRIRDYIQANPSRWEIDDDWVIA